MELPDSARQIVESGRPGHLVTPNRDRSPQLSRVRVGIEAGEIVSGHLLRRAPGRALLSATPG